MRRLSALLVLVSLGLLAPVATSWAHGDEEQAREPAPVGVGAEEAEIEEMARQPARVLAQQALSMLEITGDDVEAGERVEAALMSDDQADVDTEALTDAAEALERGEHEEAIPLLDAALSRPLGSASGSALHEAGREFEPGTGTQEVVAIIAGALLLGLGALALAFSRRRSTPRPT